MSSNKRDLLVFVARLIVGGIFIAAGWMKVSDMAVTIGYFAQMGLPAFFAYLVGYVELIGGVLVVLGLWTCLASSVLSIVMIFAAWYSRSMGFAGVFPPLAVLSSLIQIMAGAGKYSLGGKMKKADGAPMM